MATDRIYRQSWLAVVAVLGLVGALLAVGTVRPAGAVDGTADREAQYSACVGPALESLGLTDIVGSFAEDAVNCLAHYGVTRGRTETTYDPGAPVLRWQMALFLLRAASPAGVSLQAETAGGFTDLAGFSEETVNAINQMAALGIMPGTSSTTFAPNVNVTRAQMALILDAFLGKAVVGTGAFGGELDELDDVSPDDDVFEDIGQVTRGEYSAIRRMFEVGVAKGTSDDNFSPQGLVTRAQMAVFITRMLAHTVARPAGITIQAAESSVTTDDLVDLAVSVRGTGHMAVPDAAVDIFHATDPNEAFGEDGRCVSGSVSNTDGNGGVCEIAFGDEVTDPSGDYTVNRDLDLESGSITIWAWTGDVGDRYDTDDTTAPSIEITVTKPGVKLQVSDDMAANATALKYGESVTFTVQVVDEDGKAVALKDVAFSASVRETVESAAEGATASIAASTNSYKTDEDGMVELVFRQNDPRAGSNTRGDESRLDLDIGAGKLGTTTFDLDDMTTLKKAGADGIADGDAAAVWLDVVAKPSVLKLTQAVEYHEASSAGRGAANTVVATLTDQYGDPVNRQPIEFTSDDQLGIGATGDDGLMFSTASEESRLFTGAARLTRTTNRRGVASLSYQRKSADSGIETIMALARLGTTATDDDVTADRVYHYWAVEPGNGDSAAGRILTADTENNHLILVEANGPITLVKYDSNDQLNATTGAVLLADFEKELNDSDTMAKLASASNYQTTSKKVSRITLQEDPLQVVASYPAVSHDPGSNRATNTTPAALLSTAAEAWHGHSFAVADGVLVVGAPGEVDGGNADSGKVYIYETAGDTTPIVLNQGTAAADNMYGQAVALSDDGNVLVATRPGLGTSAVVDQKGDDETWAAEFGSDDHADDSTSLAIGRPDFSQGSLSPTGALDASSTLPAADRLFGETVAVSGDGQVIAVGAPADDITDLLATRGGTGIVHVYFQASGQTDWDRATRPTSWLTSTGTWTVGYLHALEASSAGGITTPLAAGMNTVSNFGGNGAIAVSENGLVIAVGTPEANLGSKNNAGAIYLYRNDDAEWDQDYRAQCKLTASLDRDDANDGTAGEMLGAAIDMSDDGLTIVATAPGSGKVYVFTAPEGTTAEASWCDTTENDYPEPDPVGSAAVITLAASNYAESELPVGRNVAIRNNGSEIVVGNGGRAEGDWRGSVSVYKKPSGGWADTSTADEEWIGSAPNQRLGWQVAYDQANGDIYASGYKPTYGTDNMGTADDATDDTRVIESAEYTIYRIDRSN